MSYGVIKELWDMSDMYLRELRKAGVSYASINDMVKKICDEGDILNMKFEFVVEWKNGKTYRRELTDSEIAQLDLGILPFSEILHEIHEEEKK